MRSTRHFIVYAVIPWLRAAVIDVDGDAGHIEFNRGSMIEDIAPTSLEDIVNSKTEMNLITTFGSEVDSLLLKHVFPSPASITSLMEIVHMS